MATATVKLFLVFGNPKRLRTAELSNWTGKAVAGPKNEFDKVLDREESLSTGVYFLTGYNIEIEFDNGKCGTIDFSMYLDRGGVFNRFKDLEFFTAFSVNHELGTLTWGDEIDIAPETLYANATGQGLPAWMEAKTSSLLNKTMEINQAT